MPPHFVYEMNNVSKSYGDKENCHQGFGQEAETFQLEVHLEWSKPPEADF